MHCQPLFNKMSKIYAKTAEKTMDMGVEFLIQHMNKQWLALFRKNPDEGMDP